MNSTFVILLIAVIYIALLFLIGFRAESISQDRVSVKRKALIYSLSIGVYCTTWTFYGAVGSASTSGMNYFAIYLGPILLFVFGGKILKRITEVSLEQKVTSISDFISSRYGKSQKLAILISVLASCALIPYLALQLKGITMSLDAITAVSLGDNDAIKVFYLTLALIIFTIIFGARKIDVTEHQHGLMNAIAFESLVKLFSFILIGSFCLFVLLGNLDDYQLAQQKLSQANIFKYGLSPDFFVQTLLAFAAMLCLPRQFHVTFVEYHNPHDLALARKIVPFYMLCFALLALPIAALGTELFTDSRVSADLYVLSIPLEQDRNLLAILTFIGGLSAGTGMVIVASTTLSTMLSNDIFLPIYVRHKKVHQIDQKFQYNILMVRRFLIMTILLLAYLCFLWIREARSLANIGLLAFSIVAHFLPAILLGVFWRQANRYGVFAGLISGAVVWIIYFGQLDHSAAGWFEYSANGYWGYSILVESTLLSLSLNLMVFVTISLITQADLNEKIQAHLFTQSTLKEKNIQVGQGIDYSELYALSTSILGVKRTESVFSQSQDVNDLLIEKVEKMLAGVIGSSSASVLIQSLRKNEKNDIATLISTTADAIRFNRDLNIQVLDNIDQGVSVVDHEKRLIAWNKAYEDLMSYPDNFLYIGKPLKEIIKYNAERGFCGPGDIQLHIDKRLSHLNQGVSYRFERIRDDGLILDIRGNPLPGGSYVTSFTDVTEYKNSQIALERVNLDLEQKVVERTSQLQSAIHDAQEATMSKTRFLAAASHDLLQPFNAAKLFTDILQQDNNLDANQHEVVSKLNASVQAAEDILGALVEMSKLDRNKLDVEISEFSLQEVFENVKNQFQHFASQKNLDLKVRTTNLWVKTDKKLLHRILQNLVSNAIRYTEEGGVLIAARKRVQNGFESALVSVIDTGFGISDENQLRVFREFERLSKQTHFGEETALGLGLSISSRIAGLLNTEIKLKSNIDKGSHFHFQIEATDAKLEKIQYHQVERSDYDLENISDLVVLAVDNESQITDAMQLSLRKWCHHVFIANSLDDVMVLKSKGLEPDLIFADYHLDDNETGIDVLKLFDSTRCEMVIVSADHSHHLQEQISEYEYQLLHKPISSKELVDMLHIAATRYK